jgi:hypothetical protein
MESSLLRRRRAAGGEEAKNGPHATGAGYVETSLVR